MPDNFNTTFDAAEVNIRVQLIWVDEGQAPDPRSDRNDFGHMLRQHRVLAELTQEDLAERAGLSPRSISDMERGASHVPRHSTVKLLAGALELSDDESAALEQSVVRRRGPRSARPARGYVLVRGVSPAW